MLPLGGSETAGTSVGAEPRVGSTSETSAPVEKEIPSRATGAPNVHSPGTCVDESSGSLTAVACDTPHEFEVLSSGQECRPGDAYAYMGGNAAVDVLRTDLRFEKIDDLCVLGIEGDLVEISFKDVLTTQSAPGLRECHDRLTNRFVACVERHTGEVVHREATNSSNPLECDSRAESYMGVSVARVFRELDVMIPPDEPRRCVLELRDESKYLISSLRNIGAGSIRAESIN